MPFRRDLARSLITAVALVVLNGGAASAEVLYQNPDPISSTPGNIDAWTINFGFQVADTFTLSTNSSLSSVDFLAWNHPGEQITSIDWLISDVPAGGTSFGSGTASVTDVFQGTNSLGFDLNLDTFSLGGLNLAAGTYWLTLQNAVALNVAGAPDTAFWDQGGGTSQAWESVELFLTPDNACGGTETTPLIDGTCGETFRINGTAGTQVPEPITLTLFGAGLAALFTALRRKSKFA